MKKNKKPKKGISQAQSIALALAFVGEHKELFKQWVESKGGKLVD